MKLVKFLNYPYPFYENTRQGLGICISIGIFIAAFCYFFMPFGLDQVSSIGLLGYGLLSFAICSFYIVLLPVFFQKHLRTEGWKIYKELLWIATIVISLAIGNYYYSGLFFDSPENPVSVFLFVVFCTAIIALIPAIAIILYKQLFVYKKIISDTQKIESKLSLRNLVHQKLGESNSSLVFSAENKIDQLKIENNDFLFLSSSGNYVEVYYLQNEILHKKLIRNNISKIENQLKKSKNVVRCHRSYLVNLDMIIAISGNLQGYKLSFAHYPEQIPVSRSYTKRVKQAILPS